MSKSHANTVLVLTIILISVSTGGCSAIQTPEAPPVLQGTPDDLTSKLEGLSLDDFFEVSWRELSLRDPEGIVGDGLVEFFELEGVGLTDISDEYIRETGQMHAEILELLRAYNRSELTPEQQISYDVYEWYLDDLVRSQEFMYYDYPATFYPITSVHERIIYFFTDLHPVANQQDAEDYVTRLGQMGIKFEQLLEGLKLREEAGIIPPRFATQWALYGVRNIGRSSAIHTPFYASFEEKVNYLEDISDAQQQALLDAAEEVIDEVVLPAYQDLALCLEHLESIGSTDDGVWQFPNGDAYYAYILRNHNTTDMTANEIQQLGLQELERIHTEMRDIFDELGYPEDESLAALFDRVEKDGGNVPANKVLETYTNLIEQADKKLDPIFNIGPEAEVIVIASPIKGMYESAAFDGSRPGTFHAGPCVSSEPRYAMPTLAYHEAIPGHHFQIAIAQEMDLPTFRNHMEFTGYAEGWALYAEQLVYELGWYEDDPYGNLGRLQAEAFRAARLVIDTGIHAEGWTFDQSLEYLIENVGFEPDDSIDPEIQIARYIVWPGQATAYKIGMLKILELRQKAIDQLGDKFDLKEFHSLVLGNGSMPLEILERVVDNYIETQLKP